MDELYSMDDKQKELMGKLAKEIGLEGWDYCITFLSCGEKYNAALLNTINNNKEFDKIKCKIFIVTDDPKTFQKKAKKEVWIQQIDPIFLKDVRSDRKRSWFNFHLKREAIDLAHRSGYNKIFYMDSDINLLKWDEDFFIKKQKGFWFRTFLTKENHEEKYKHYSKLYNADLWHYYRPVSEKIMYINEGSDKINGFLKTWEKLDMESRGILNPYTEGHEIFLSLRFNGCDIHRYNPDPFKKRGEGKKMEDNSK
jgi:hypothetical protein